ELRGKPVVIGGGRNATPKILADGTRRFARLRDYVGRGVVTTSTYEARAFGVFSAMGMMKAAQLAPDAILLPTDFESYRRYSRLFKDAVGAFTDQMEDRGIDEIYIDLTAVTGESRELGDRIKAAVRQATSLTCSIAIAPNKLLAKIGSELDKPDGLTVLTMADLESRIWPLAAKKINGIGPRATERLAGIGIATVGELAAADPGLLQEHFGRTYAEWFARVARGIDDRPIVVASEPKSMSRETTFERDMHVNRDRVTLTPALTRLCERVADDLQRKGYGGRTVGLKIKFADFRIVTRDLSLPEAVTDAAAIRRAAGECLKRVPLDRRIRLIGVRIGSLERTSDSTSAVSPAQHELPFDR
ncbi:TPA: DNA polymerase IV, partial [Burkholderia cenocepacia]|nr:DNA polymerase IV [Burkholderia cenocepacia]